MPFIVTPYQIEICRDIVSRSNREERDYVAHALGFMTNKALLGEFMIEELVKLLNDPEDIKKCKMKAFSRMEQVLTKT